MSLFSRLFNPFSSDDSGELMEKNDCSQKDPSPSNVKPSGSNEVAPDTQEVHNFTSISDVGILSETVREAILDSVIPFTGNDDFIGLYIWVNDISYQVINKDTFIQELRASFDSMHLYFLGKGEIKIFSGEPSKNDDASPVIKNGVISHGKIWIHLIEKNKAKENYSKAKICVLQGFGSCTEKEYVLNSDEKQVYHIGRGFICRKPAASYRVNDIVIEENNPDITVQKLNNYVSSAQADVIIDNGSFYLKALPSGCRTSGGSPTKIIRNQEPFELRDSVSAHLLKNGDIIELGKSVLLHFLLLE